MKGIQLCEWMIFLLKSRGFSGHFSVPFRVSVKFMCDRIGPHALICRQCITVAMLTVRHWSLLWAMGVDGNRFQTIRLCTHPSGRSFARSSENRGNFPANRAGKPQQPKAILSSGRQWTMDALLLLMESKFEPINRSWRPIRFPTWLGLYWVGLWNARMECGSLLGVSHEVKHSTIHHPKMLSTSLLARCCEDCELSRRL